MLHDQGDITLTHIKVIPLIDPETHEETKSTVPYALHMDQTALVMALHGFGNVIDVERRFYLGGSICLGNSSSHLVGHLSMSVAYIDLATGDVIFPAV